MKTDEEFDKYARELQKVHFELLHGSSYDVIGREDLDKFKLILDHYLPGDAASKIYDTFIHKGSDLIFRILIINCKSDESFFSVPVIRVLEDGRPVFFDNHCRKYSDWKDFLSFNKLPKCLMMYPENGSYIKENGLVKLGTIKSPSSSFLSKADKFIYVTAEVVSVLSSVAPMFGICKPYASAIKWVSGLSNGYQIAHHSYQLYDRYTHGQLIDLSDEAAKVHWSHIGNGFVSFLLTYSRVEITNPSGKYDWENFVQFLSICQRAYSEQDPQRGLNLVRGHVLSQHLICLSGEATVYFQKLLSLAFGKDSQFFISKIIISVKSYLGADLSSAFRRLIYVDDISLKKVAHDVKQSNEINHCFSTKVYDLLSETMVKVDSIMQEVNSWKWDKISEDQLKFRVTEICRGCRKYETLPEMCCYYNVKNIEDIVINGKKIFNDVGTGRCDLDNLVSASAKCFPQILLYSVEYASTQDGNIDWDGFKEYFIDRIRKEKLSEIRPFTEIRHEINWINSINFQVVKFSMNKTENVIDLLKPKRDADEHICIQDLVNLGKKILGSLNIEFIIFEADIKWVVLISKVINMAAIIAPKMERLNSLKGSYPVFVRAI